MFNEISDTERHEHLAGSLYTICQADQVLSKGEYKEKLAELKSIGIVEPSLFDEYYWHLFACLFDYMQFIPDPRQRNYPMINVALAKAKVAFKNVEKYKDSRFQYAYISLSVFADLGVCLSDYEVVIADSEGKPLDLWHPLVRGLSNYVGYHYKIRPHNFKDKKIRHLSNPILACNIMPESGLVFLREDPLLFGQWIRALCGEDDTGDLAAGLDAVKAFPRSSMVSDMGDPVHDCYGHVEAFWQWVLANLHDGKNCQTNKGQVSFDLDSLAKEYSQGKNISCSELKKKLKDLKVISEVNAINEKSRSSGFSMFDAATKKAVNYKINASVKLASGSYYRAQGSIIDASNKRKDSIKIANDQNQQMT